MKMDDCQAAANLVRWWRENKSMLKQLGSPKTEARLEFPAMCPLPTQDEQFVEMARTLAMEIVAAEIIRLEHKLKQLGVELPPEDAPIARAA